jgi:hypothetical protein
MLQDSNKYKQGKVLDIVDPKLEGQYPREQALRVDHNGTSLHSRFLGAAAGDVMGWLAADLEIRVHPTKPTFVDVVAARPVSSTTTTNSATSTSVAAARPSSSAAKTYSTTSTSAAESHQCAGSMTVSLLPA